MTLSFTTIADPTLRGCGTIVSASVNADGSMLAVGSTFPLLNNLSARAAYAGQTLRNRLSLYRQGETAPFAVIDSLGYPIQAMDFHPRLPVLLIGAGAYDGGWSYEGDLVVWDWSRNRVWRPFQRVPEVVACRFAEGGDGIEILVMPWDEEWPEPPDSEEAVEAIERSRYPLSLPWSEADFDKASLVEAVLEPQSRQAREATTFAVWAARREAAQARVAAWLGVEALERRGPIRDLQWLADGQLAVTHEDCHLEIYATSGERTARFTGQGSGREILQSDPVVVHVADEPTYAEEIRGQKPRADLFMVGGDTLSLLTSLTGRYSFSASSDGRLLGRRDRSRERDRDPGEIGDAEVRIADGSVRSRDLGHYDCFNGYVGIDGAPDLFLMHDDREPGGGLNASTKTLARLSASGAVQMLWPPGEHRRDRNGGAVECCGAWVDDSAGAGVVLTGRFHHPDPFHDISGFAFRRGLKARSPLWWLDTASAASAVVSVADRGIVAIALLSGQLMMLDAGSGEVLADAPVRLDGCDSVIFCMDVQGDQLACGTLDGRIALVSLAGLQAAPRRKRFWRL